MKLRYTLPVRGLLRVCDDRPLQMYGWTFQFLVNENTGYVDGLVIEIASVPEEHWPELVEVEQDPNSVIPRFPFSVNPRVLRFGQIEPYVINLESYLSVFGLEAVDFVNIKEEWLRDAKDEQVGMFAGFSSSPYKPEPVAEPLTRDMLSRCIVASGAPEKETAALAHFRIGQMHFLNRRFIKAIRHLYMCLEYQYANGKTKNNSVLKEFRMSEELKSAVSKLFLVSHHNSFERLRGKYDDLKNANDPREILKFLVNLRGHIQHANERSLKMWHPSREYKFENEAVCVMNLAEELCLEMTMLKLTSIPSCR